MNELYFKAITAGIVFGIWPLVMNRSGLNGNVSAAVFSAVALLGILPFAVRSGGASMVNANWTMAIIAGLLGAIGLLLFNGVLAKATKDTVSSLFVLVIILQIMMPALNQTVILHQFSYRKIIGFAVAALAAILLA